MIYDKPPFKYTRSKTNPLEVYGKKIKREITPWELLDLKVEFEGRISKNATVENSEIDETEGPVRILEGATVKNSEIRGPAWIGAGAALGPNALVRSGSIGKECKIGQSSEIKNSLIMKGTNVPHLSYVGDSIIGSNVNLAAGTVLSNLRHDEKNIELRFGEEEISTGKRKFGCLIGDCVKTGANTSIYEGRILGPFATTGPGSTIKYNLGPFQRKCDGKVERMSKEEVISTFPKHEKKIKNLWEELCVE